MNKTLKAYSPAVYSPLTYQHVSVESMQNQVAEHLVHDRHLKPIGIIYFNSLLIPKPVFFIPLLTII